MRKLFRVTRSLTVFGAGCLTSPLLEFNCSANNSFASEPVQSGKFTAGFGLFSICFCYVVYYITKTQSMFLYQVRVNK